MGRNTNDTGIRLMSHVVIDEDWHSNDVHGHVSRHDEEDTLLSVVVNGKDIVSGRSLKPMAIKHEEQAGEVMIALSQDNTLFVDKFPHSIGHASKDLLHERLEVEAGYHNGGGASVQDRVE